VSIHYEANYETPLPATPVNYLARVVCVLAGLMWLAALILRLGLEPATALDPHEVYVAAPGVSSIYVRPKTNVVTTCALTTAMGTKEFLLRTAGDKYGAKEQTTPGTPLEVSCDHQVSVASGPLLVAYPLFDRDIWNLIYLLIFALGCWLGWPRVRRRFVTVRSAG
jgi:hypothetical protein